MKDNKKNEILLSIAIPTKDRYDYLKYFLEIMKSFSSNEVELVVHDNTFDNTSFQTFINNNSFSFLKYYHIQNPISMSSNCEEAVSHCNGKYVCLMGDDDFVTKELIDFVRYMDKNGIETASFCEKAHYSWPGVKYVKHKIPNLFIPHFNGKIKQIDNKKGLQKLVAHGASELKKIPKFYHGVVLREKLLEIKRQTGLLFIGESPDISIGIALSIVSDNHIVCDTPFVVSGTVPKSAGGMGAAHKHNNEIENVPWLSKDAKDNWEKTIPEIWTGTTVYADTAIKTLAAFNEFRLLKEFNYIYSYAFTLVFEDGCWKYVRKLVGKNPMRWIKLYFYLIKITLYRAFHYIDNIRVHKFNFTRAYKMNGINNSFIASMETSKIISKDRSTLYE